MILMQDLSDYLVKIYLLLIMEILRIFGRINSGMLKDLKNFLEVAEPFAELQRQISLLHLKIDEMESRHE